MVVGSSCRPCLSRQIQIRYSSIRYHRPFLPSFACLPPLYCLSGLVESDEPDKDGQEEELQQGGKSAAGGAEKGKASGGADKGKAKLPKVQSRDASTHQPVVISCLGSDTALSQRATSYQ